MSDRTYVCDRDELEEGGRTVVSVNGREVGVFRVEGEYYAISNVCPHQRGPVCEGRIKQEIAGEFVESGQPVHEYYSGVRTISCPWHGWEYDIETGEHVGDRRIALPTFDVIVEGDEIYLET